MSEETTLQRIKQYLDYKGITNKKFEETVGFSNGAFGSQLKNNRTIGVDKLENILSVYEELNPNWLLRGKGKMINDEDYAQGSVNLDTVEEIKGLYKNGVPYYDVDFTASFLEITNNQQTKPDHYVSHPFFKGCDYIVRASGQSMAKVIKHGDAIGLVEIKNWQEFIPLGEIYAIVTKNNFRMIKIITKGEDQESYTLISKPSDSKKDEFPPQQIKKKQILSVFKVQAASHLF